MLLYGFELARQLVMAGCGGLDQSLKNGAGVLIVID
jgi:hypothetical protein